MPERRKRDGKERKEKRNLSVFVVSRAEASPLSVVLFRGVISFGMRGCYLAGSYLFFLSCRCCKKSVRLSADRAPRLIHILVLFWRQGSDWTRSIQVRESSVLDGWHSSFLYFSVAPRRATWAPFKDNDARSQVESMTVTRSSNTSTALRNKMKFQAVRFLSVSLSYRSPGGSDLFTYLFMVFILK